MEWVVKGRTYRRHELAVCEGGTIARTVHGGASVVSHAGAAGECSKIERRRIGRKLVKDLHGSISKS